MPVLLALGFATGFIHYLLDRSVYRMSDPQVRAAASGLVGNGTRPSRRKNVSSFAVVLVLAFVFVCSLHAQTGTAGQQPPKAIYTPQPVYRPEWAKQGLTGKGVALVTIDQQTGKVTGVRMLQSTGNKQLDGAALEAYSQWRFQPGTGSQVKIPIEFANRPKPAAPKQAKPPTAIVYALLILLGFGVAVIAMRMRSRGAR
jgi:TonB family protein